MSDAALMELADVRFAYHRRRPVIGGVSVAVAPGRMHMLIGPNAAGKTTLLRLMLGHLRPEAGRVLMAGRRVHRLSAVRRAGWLAYVPQRASIAFAYTVREMVRMGRYAIGDDEAAVDRALRRCELADLAGRPFVELSVGQQQRVLLARAVAQATGAGRLMLLDEPTSAMDLAHVHRSMTLLRELADTGLAIVAVAQDLNVTARYADRVWLLRDGRLVADGEWYDVLRPSILEPVYGVKLRWSIAGDRLDPKGPRPIFDACLPPEGGGE